MAPNKKKGLAEFLGGQTGSRGARAAPVGPVQLDSGGLTCGLDFGRFGFRPASAGVMYLPTGPRGAGAFTGSALSAASYAASGVAALPGLRPSLPKDPKDDSHALDEPWAAFRAPSLLSVCAMKMGEAAAKAAWCLTPGNRGDGDLTIPEAGNFGSEDDYLASMQAHADAEFAAAVERRAQELDRCGDAAGWRTARVLNAAPATTRPGETAGTLPEDESRPAARIAVSGSADVEDEPWTTHLLQVRGDKALRLVTFSGTALSDNCPAAVRGLLQPDEAFLFLEPPLPPPHTGSPPLAVRSLGYVGSFLLEYTSAQELRVLRGAGRLPPATRALLAAVAAPGRLVGDPTPGGCPPQHDAAGHGTLLPPDASALDTSRIPINGSQKEAILGLSAGLSLIHGPPGTGKSTTIYHIIAARVRPGSTVLVTCARNQAVNAVVSKVAGLPGGALVFGSEKNLGPDARQHTLPGRIAADGAVAWHRSALLAVASSLRCLADVADNRGLPAHAAAADADATPKSVAAPVAPPKPGRRKGGKAKSADAPDPGHYSDPTTGLLPRRRPPPTPADDADAIETLTAAVAAAAAVWDSAESVPDAAVWAQGLPRPPQGATSLIDRAIATVPAPPAVPSMAAVVPSPPAGGISPWTDIDRAVMAAGASAHALHTSLQRLRAPIEAAAKVRVLRGTRVLLCTIDSSPRMAAEYEGLLQGGGGGGAGLRIDTVIVDEAACVLEASVPVLLKWMPANLVLVGDHLQLPPYSAMEESDPRMGVHGRSLMERAIAAGRQAPLLGLQYRMHPSICDTISSLFYGGRLRTAPLVERQRSRFASGHGPRRWVPVTAPEIDHFQSGFSNEVEAHEAVEAAAAARGAAPGCTLAIVTFYARQKAALERCVRERVAAGDGRLRGVAVLTVDSVQGSESDVVVVSTVRSVHDRPLSGFLRDPRRINVALSRARELCVVVGNPETMGARGGDAWRGVVASYRRVPNGASGGGM